MVNKCVVVSSCLNALDLDVLLYLIWRLCSFPVVLQDREVQFKIGVVVVRDLVEYIEILQGGLQTDRRSGLCKHAVSSHGEDEYDKKFNTDGGKTSNKCFIFGSFAHVIQLKLIAKDIKTFHKRTALVDKFHY